MRASSWNKHEIFSKTCVPPENPFFVRLNGWKFKKLSETIKTEKPFDRRIAESLVSSGKALFRKGFNPALIYIVSDELNALFLGVAPFRGRIEKMDSVLAGLVSSAFALSLQKLFGVTVDVAFDSRVVVASDVAKAVEYLVWRQMDAWRNHNNAYAYWIFRKTGLAPSEISEKLKGLKTGEIHEIAFKQGVNLAETPQWQRRGVLLYKQPLLKQTETNIAERWMVKEEWSLPLFTSENGKKLIKQIIEWARRGKEEK
ncbi:MAG: tRNA(His) guanylyltransferase Thg1 family protein [Candidatus Bathyarchaeia archaeon]